jgi:glycosyltransferase involved in cell wall biosynthesis
VEIIAHILPYLPNSMTIYLTVTNDLSYDQRMARICGSLAGAGYQVILVGRKLAGSIPLSNASYKQVRLRCWFNKGKLFYAEYNLRLFFFLLFKKMDCICAIDLDTILPCLFISKLKKTKRVYDAHELFCEMKEIVTRPMIYKTWKKIEQYALPQFAHAYTVNQPIADEFYKMYGIKYGVIMNVPVSIREDTNTGGVVREGTNHGGGSENDEKYIIYQGAVNEGRCFETLIPAMKEVHCRLIICGDGNFMQQAKQLVKENNLEDRIIFKGNVAPAELRKITAAAYAGINLVENNGLSFYLSLANKFFDYIHARVPQLCAGYPAYTAINDKHEVAVAITDMSAKNIALQLNNLLQNEVLYKRLQDNCNAAMLIYNWQNEEKKLLDLYTHILG